MKELESEIKQYKVDNKRLKEKAQKVERDLAAIEQDRIQITELQRKQEAAWEAKEEEMQRKLKAERRVMERQIKAKAMQPDRKYVNVFPPTHILKVTVETARKLMP